MGFWFDPDPIPDLVPWALGLRSFFRERRRLNAWSRWLTETRVRCLTLLESAPIMFSMTSQL